MPELAMSLCAGKHEVFTIISKWWHVEGCGLFPKDGVGDMSESSTASKGLLKMTLIIF